MSELLTRLKNHRAMMAPHQAEREAGKLLIEAIEEIDQAERRIAVLQIELDATQPCRDSALREILAEIVQVWKDEGCPSLAAISKARLRRADEILKAGRAGSNA